jgi:hypothetical protein
MKLCHHRNPQMSDVERVDHLKKELRPSLLKKVLDRDPTTPDEFIEVVLKAESNQRILQMHFDMNARTPNNPLRVFPWDLYHTIQKTSQISIKLTGFVEHSILRTSVKKSSPVACTFAEIQPER